MTTVRIQVRRGTAAEWEAVDPILEPGEIGLESDTNYIKFGNGVDVWTELGYANDPGFLDITNSLVNYVEIADIGATSGVAGLDSSKNLLVPGASIIIEGGTNNDYETTLTVTDPTADRTITFPNATGTVALTSDITTAVNALVDGAPGALDTLNELAAALNDDASFAATITSTLSTKQDVVTNVGDTEIGYLVNLTSNVQSQLDGKQAVVSGVSDTEIGYLDGVTSAIQGQINSKQDKVTGVSDTEISYLDGVTSSIQTQLNNKQSVVANVSDIEISYLDGVTSSIQTQLNAKATTSDVTNHTSATTSVHGITNTADLATKTYADGKASDAQTNAINAAEIAAASAIATAVSNHESDSTNVHGIADTSVLVTSTQLAAKQDKITGVSDTEIGYLDGVTSAIQTQIDGKSSTNHTHTLSAVTDVTASASELNTLDGITASTSELNTLDGITASTAELNILDGITASTSELNILDGATLTVTELNYVDGVTSSIQTQLNGKQPIVSGVSDTEIGYLDGVTSSIQTQLNNKQDKVSGVSDTEIGYLDGVTSAIQTQIDSKLAISTASSTYAPLSGPTFTGTVTLPGTTSIGNVSATEIGYVDGVTSSIQTQLDDKLSKTGGTMTGLLTLSGAPTSDLHAATKLYVDNVTSGINFHQAVHVATTSNLSADYNNGTDGVGATLTGSANGAWPTIDGHTSFTQYDRILVKDQTDSKQNGIYILSDLGGTNSKWILTRATDADNNPSGEMKNGDFVLVLNGTANGSYGFINNSTANPIAIGTNNITYTAFNAAKAISAGNGLSELIPGILSIDTAVTADLSTSQTLTNKTINGSSNTITNVSLTSGVTGTLPVANGGTGITSLGTGIAAFLGTPSASNLAAAVTEETGSGSLVFATSPTLVTPNIGVATGTSFNSITGLSSTTPAMDGTAAVGTATTAARADHVHGTDTSRAPLNSPTFTGTVTLPIGTVTSAMILDETIVDGDINSSAAIAQSKISNLTSDLAAKAPLASPTFTGTVTLSASGIAFTDGTQTKQGVPSQTEIIQKTAAYTLSSLLERDDLIEVSHTGGTAVDITIPTDSTLNFPIGTSIDILRTNTGKVRVVGAVGVTVNSTPGAFLRDQWSSATLFKRAANTWVLIGDLATS